MTGFNHTLTGTLIAVLTPAPFQPLIALLSHYVLDSLPHFGRDSRFVPYNRNFKLLLLFDAILCVLTLSLSIFLFPTLWWLMIICAAMATLPDFLWAIKDRAPAWLNPQYYFHTRIQWGERPYGWLFEGLFFLSAISVLFILA